MNIEVHASSEFASQKHFQGQFKNSIVKYTEISDGLVVNDFQTLASFRNEAWILRNDHKYF